MVLDFVWRTGTVVQPYSNTCNERRHESFKIKRFINKLKKHPGVKPINNGGFSQEIFFCWPMYGAFQLR